MTAPPHPPSVAAATDTITIEDRVRTDWLISATSTANPADACGSEARSSRDRRFAGGR
jgi:hypothetical protein